MRDLEAENIWFRNGILFLNEPENIGMSRIQRNNNKETLRFIANKDGRIFRPVFFIEVSYDGKKIKARALFDIGSNKSCVTKDVIEILNLKKIDDGVIFQDVCNEQLIYLLSFIFGEDIKYTNIKVMEVRMHPEDPEPFDVVVGMDILRTGDFSIKSSSGDTKFTFEVGVSENKDGVS